MRVRTGGGAPLWADLSCVNLALWDVIWIEQPIDPLRSAQLTVRNTCPRQQWGCTEELFRVYPNQTGISTAQVVADPADRVTAPMDAAFD